MAPPTSTVRYSTRARIMIVIVLTLGIGAFVVAGLTTVTEDDPGFTVSGVPGQQVQGDVAVEARVPGEDDQVLGQQTFGIDLGPGWTGELLLLPAEGVAISLPEDELNLVPELNQILYQPLPGKTIERLPTGTNCVVATIWSQVEGREASERVEQWCFEVF